jgi:NADH:ubiquinone oxidoreductase subunit 2 (subunit N)
MKRKKAHAVIGMSTSLISAYYYPRVVVTMSMKEGEPQTTAEPWLNLTWGSMAVLNVLVSLVPAPLIAWASPAVLKLF